MEIQIRGTGPWVVSNGGFTIEKLDGETKKIGEHLVTEPTFPKALEILYDLTEPVPVAGLEHIRDANDIVVFSLASPADVLLLTQMSEIGFPKIVAI